MPSSSKPGRKSRASLAVVPTEIDGSPHVTSHRRADPPRNLTEAQAALWIEIVEDLPANWFPRHTHELLATYVRHAVHAEHLAQLIDAAERETDDSGKPSLDLGRYKDLLHMHEKEGRALSSLATRLRLTQQATRSPDTKKPPQRVAPPWET